MGLVPLVLARAALAAAEVAAVDRLNDLAAAGVAVLDVPDGDVVLGLHVLHGVREPVVVAVLELVAVIPALGLGRGGVVRFLGTRRLDLLIHAGHVVRPHAVGLPSR